MWVNSTCYWWLELTDVNKAVVCVDDVSFLGRMKQKFSTNQNFLYVEKINIMQWPKKKYPQIHNRPYILSNKDSTAFQISNFTIGVVSNYRPLTDFVKKKPKNSLPQHLNSAVTQRLSASELLLLSSGNFEYSIIGQQVTCKHSTSSFVQ